LGNDRVRGFMKIRSPDCVWLASCSTCCCYHAIFLRN
jgi:formate hydrogenlyase subunit 6/NADH:ubiquinone oxidoreductase subunit I